MIDSCGNIITMVRSASDKSPLQVDHAATCWACQERIDHTQAYHAQAVLVELVTGQANRPFAWRTPHKGITT